MRPAAVIVLGQSLTIEYTPKGLLDRDPAAGHTNLEAQRIEVGEGQAHHQERDTLVHELLHAIGMIVGQRLKEREVAAFAPVLLDVLRSNPAVVAYLTEPMQ